MAVVDITVLNPKQDGTKSLETGEITASAVTTPADGVKILNALDNKNNSLQIYIQNTTTSGGSAADSSAVVKAGDHYPNKVLGDASVVLGAGKTVVVLLEDISRFENKDKSIKLTFGTGFTGNVWAVAKRAGVMPKADQDVVDGIV